MAGREEQDAWVARVLGVRAEAAGSTGGAPEGHAARLMAVWQDAKDEVDDGINRLAALVRGEGDPDLDQIADRGLIGVTGGTAVQLTKAFLEYRSAAPGEQAQAASSLRDAAQAYRDTVFAHPMIDLIDNNPWGVKVNLRSRLNAALDTVIREAA